MKFKKPTKITSILPKLSAKPASMESQPKPKNRVHIIPTLGEIRKEQFRAKIKRIEYEQRSPKRNLGDD